MLVTRKAVEKLISDSLMSAAVSTDTKIAEQARRIELLELHLKLLYQELGLTVELTERVPPRAAVEPYWVVRRSGEAHPKAGKRSGD